MKVLLIILLSVFSLLFIIICGYDALLRIAGMIKRYKIGTLSEAQWAQKVKTVAKKWLKKTPDLKLTNDSSYAIIEKLTGENKSDNVSSWQKAALILGLCDCDEEIDTDLFFDENGNFRKDYSGVDSAMLAFSLLKATEDKQSIKPAMDKTFELVKSFCDEDGIVQYNNNSGNYYVDSIGLVCPFLAEYGAVYNNVESQKLCLNQIAFFTSRGLCDKNSLPNHCIKKDGTPVSVYAWGRGCAWYALGLIDSFDYLPEDGKNRLLPVIKKFADTLLKYELPEGGFSNLLTVSGYDSSATAALGFFFARAGKLLNRADYTKCADNCLNKLISYTMTNGEIDSSQGDTHGLGNFSTVYDIMPFTQGMALRLYSC